MFRNFSVAHPQRPTEKSRRVLENGFFNCKNFIFYYSVFLGILLNFKY